MSNLNQAEVIKREETIALVSKQLKAARNQKNFEDWIALNPQVVDHFVNFARAAKKAGHKQISAWLIVNRVRWETEIITTGNAFKISNNYIAPLSRMVMDQYADLSGFFTTRT